MSEEIKDDVVAIIVFFDRKTAKIVGKPKVYDPYDKYIGWVMKDE